MFSAIAFAKSFHVISLINSTTISVRYYYLHVKLIKLLIREVKTLIQGHTTVRNDLNINYNFKISKSSL